MSRRLFPRLGFRVRLTLIIAGVFIAAGGVLLTAQFVVVQQLFASAVHITVEACGSEEIAPAPSDRGDEPFRCPSEVPPGDVPAIVGDGPTESGSGSTDHEPTPEGNKIAGQAAITQTMYLSDRIVGGLLAWSVGLLVAFAVIAAVISVWLARRPLDRIGEVTAAAREISERDLARRLQLPGPDDEIKELGDTFDGMLDRLQIAFTAQDRFVANASHELRTPLTTARTALEIPLAHGDVPRELEPSIRRALRATEHSERLIDALLALARGSVIHERERVAVSPLIEEARADLASTADERGVAISVDLAPAAALGDAVLLERAVRNLIDNAVRHNVRGGTVEVEVATVGQDVVIEVANTGPELDDATVALLVEPFYRGERSRISDPTGGVGLGLAIVHSIATTHGGRLDLSPREGGGLLARFTVPSAPAAPAGPAD